MASVKPLVLRNGLTAQLQSSDSLLVSGLSNTGAVIESGVITPAALTGTGSTNDYAPTGFANARVVLQDVSGGNRTITGIAGGVAGRIVTFVNLSVDSSGLVFTSQDAGSAAANRIINFGNTDAKLFGPGSSATFWYDGAASRWRLLSITSATTAITTFSALSTNGLATFSTTNLLGATAFSGVVTPASISGTVDDYNPTNLGSATTLEIALSAAATLTGLSAAVVSTVQTGRILFLENLSDTFSLTLKHDNAGSTGANRFYLPSAADLVIPPFGAAFLRYNTTASRWRVAAA